jgi:hypothetical protein
VTAELVREIAEQIVQEQLLLNWRFYGLLAAIALVVHVLGNFVSSYARKRGETLATKSDMQEILNQLKTTTQATEEIKASVSHSDWVSREWKQVRRLKLEELMSTAYSLDKWLDQNRDKWILQREVEPEHDPVDRVTMLGALYFPELKAEVQAVTTTHRGALSAILRASPKVRAAEADWKAKAANVDEAAKAKAVYQAALDEFAGKWMAVYQPAIAATAALAAKAAKLMQEIGGA